MVWRPKITSLQKKHEGGFDRHSRVDGTTAESIANIGVQIEPCVPP